MAFTTSSTSGYGGDGYAYAGAGGSYGEYPFASPPPQPPPPAATGPAAPTVFGGGGGDSAGDLAWRMGLNYGQSLLQQGLEKGEQDARKYVPYWTRLRAFFAVDNRYVTRKLGILLFPFTQRFPSSAGQAGGQGGNAGPVYGHTDEQAFGSPTTARGAPPGFGTAAAAANTPTVLPTQDVFVSDLYIPLMAVITYLLLSAVLYGLATLKPVTTAFLASTLTTVTVWVAVEVALSKALSYFLRIIPGVSLLDLIALSGYKYVLVCLAILTGCLTSLLYSSRLAVGVLVLYVVAANTAFVVKFVRRENTGEGGRVLPRAKLLAYAIAVVQLPCIMWMCLRPTLRAISTVSTAPQAVPASGL